ncbi:hypothetical protein DDZ13_14995 [Coraliomargarita sinensis]|uniref:Uncharacterized protein n=1 Tax=Coraliomargarita sinensis TaxID=2174842 RepID=A0A317ZGF9_9BACT|nr:hypothetical protein [Coraliomargarita sinensis]PXA02859.1 hypothetical protein DDZ13_14995 [Coraliomargarita sinensis]
MKKQTNAILAACCVLFLNLQAVTDTSKSDKETKFQLKLSKQYGESFVYGELQVSAGFYPYDPIILFAGNEDKALFQCNLVPVVSNSRNKRLDYERTFTFGIEPEIVTHGKIFISGQEILLRDQVVEVFDSPDQARMREKAEYLRSVQESDFPFFKALDSTYEKKETNLNKANIEEAFHALFPEWEIGSIDQAVDLDRTVNITLNHDSGKHLLFMLIHYYEIRIVEDEGKIRITGIPEVDAQPTKQILYSELTRKPNPNQAREATP